MESNGEKQIRVVYLKKVKASSVSAFVGAKVLFNDRVFDVTDRTIGTYSTLLTLNNNQHISLDNCHTLVFYDPRMKPEPTQFAYGITEDGEEVANFAHHFDKTTSVLGRAWFPKTKIFERLFIDNYLQLKGGVLLPFRVYATPSLFIGLSTHNIAKQDSVHLRQIWTQIKSELGLGIDYDFDGETKRRIGVILGTIGANPLSPDDIENLHYFKNYILNF